MNVVSDKQQTHSQKELVKVGAGDPDYFTAKFEYGTDMTTCPIQNEQISRESFLSQPSKD